MADCWSNAHVRPMTVDEAGRIASWRYSASWSVYDLSSVQPLIDDLASYYAVMAGETLIGFCCTGDAARIPGLAEQPATVDVGMGMDPTLVGRGYGTAFGRTVLAFLAGTYPDKALRAVVQGWNERTLRLTYRLGFEAVGNLTAVQGGRPVVYRIVVKRQQREPINE
jgi:RimJ/RimL family protein N-acetyltransferase